MRLFLSGEECMNLLFFDIDGTLAVRTTVPQSAAEAIAKVRENGDKVFICTGRNPAYVKKNFSQYADGFICSNGRYAFMGDDVLYDHPVSVEAIREIQEALRPIGGSILFNGIVHGYFSGDEEGFKVMSAVQQDGYVQREDDPEKMDPIYAYDVWFTSKEMLGEMAEALKGVCLFNPHGPHPTADVTVLGVDKGTALVHVAERLNVPLENTYAFGDGINDICMLEAAGNAIAMGNGMPEVKAAADFVTTEIMDDGVKNAMIHYHLI